MDTTTGRIGWLDAEDIAPPVRWNVDDLIIKQTNYTKQIIQIAKVYCNN